MTENPAETVNIWAASLSEYVRFLAFIIAFLLVGVFGSRQTWITTDILVSMGFGVGHVLAPGLMTQFMVEGNLTSVLYFLLRVFGITMLSSAVVWYITRDTRDGTVPITLIMSRVFSVSTMLLVQLYTYYYEVRGKKTTKWTNQFIVYGVWGTMLWLGGNLLHLLRSSDFNTYPQHNIRLHSHLRLDAWLMMLSAILAISFPDAILSNLFQLKFKDITCVHLHTVRAIGALNLGECVVSLQAPGFLHERDKMAILGGRIFSQLLLLIPWLYVGLWSGMISVQALTAVIIASLPVLTNAVLPHITNCTVIYPVPPSSQRAKKDD